VNPYFPVSIEALVTHPWGAVRVRNGSTPFPV
jgi:hypothetical protein